MEAFREIGDERELAGALANLGVRYRHQGRLDQANAALAEALDLRRRVGDRGGEARTLGDLGSVALDTGDPRGAIRLLELARTLLRRAGPRDFEPKILGSLGIAHRQIGDLRTAMALQEQALALYRELGDHHGEARALINIGNLHNLMGAGGKGLPRYAEAVALAGSSGDSEIEGLALHNAAAAWDSLGQPDRALDLYDDALAVRESIDDALGSSLTRTGIAIALIHQGAHTPAREHLQEAIALQRRVGARRAEGLSLNNLGIVNHQLAEYEEALACYRESLKIARETGDLAGVAGRLNNIALVLLDRGDAQRAIPYLREAIRVHRRCDDRRSEALALPHLAHALRALGEHTKALAAFDEAVEILEGLRGEVLGDDARMSYFATVSDVYAEYAVYLIDQGAFSRAFELAERGKGRAFLDLLAEARARPAAQDDELQQRVLRLEREWYFARRALDAERSRGGGGGRAGVVAQMRERERELEQAFRSAAHALHERPVDDASFELLAPRSLDDIRRTLLAGRGRRAIVEYVIGPRASGAIVVLEDEIAGFVVRNADAIGPMVRELVAAVTHGVELRLACYPHGRALFTLLLAPVYELLRDKDLLIVPDGVLAYLPFGLLLTQDQEGDHPWAVEPLVSSDPNQAQSELAALLAPRLRQRSSRPWRELPYLVRAHSIAHAPSATVASFQSESGYVTEEFATALLAVGDPVHPKRDLSLPRLPGALDEVWQVAGLFSSEAASLDCRPERYEDGLVRVRTGSSATREEVMRLVSADDGLPVRYLLISSHGRSDAMRPEFSGLLLPSEATHDEWWSAFDIRRASLPVDVAVLSACETGVGPVVGGEGAVSLARAFAVAGARTVCVSLWKVADLSTPALVARLFRGLLMGIPRAEALRQAQLEILDGSLADAGHPYHWAGFIMSGDPAGSGD